MRFALVFLFFVGASGCDASCDHGPYCSEDGLHIVTCSERGDIEYVDRCRGEAAVCIDMKGESFCAQSSTKEPLCGDDSLNLICKQNVKVICRYGYQVSEKDCSIGGFVCSPGSGACLMSSTMSDAGDTGGEP